MPASSLHTDYDLNGGSWSTYTAPILVSAEGTSTLRYRSADVAGHVEATKTVSVRVDTQPPTVPGALLASAVSTSAVELLWNLSTDAVSGLARYAVYRDGTFVGTATGTTFVDSGLTAGSTHSYRVSAVDVAGNESARSASASETVPAAALWISVTPASVDMGSTDPGMASTVTSAAIVTVGGVGSQQYDFLCSADDFTNADPLALMPTLPASALSFTGRGFAAIPLQPFSTVPAAINTATGSKYAWTHEYVFDYTFDAPWTFDAGVYSTTVVYTVVAD